MKEKVVFFINKIKNVKLLPRRKTQTLPEPEEMDEYIYNHADELMDRYETQFQDFYEESAAEDASDYYSENYEEINEPDWDMMPGGHDDWYDDGDI